MMPTHFDLLICHASEDKESFVRPLAIMLRSLGVTVWYDEFSLKPGTVYRVRSTVELLAQIMGLLS